MIQFRRQLPTEMLNVGQLRAARGTTSQVLPNFFFLIRQQLSQNVLLQSGFVIM
jgi:hypothetical protein